MNLIDVLPRDELTLAQLTAAKLAKIMHGLMSVGTASLGMETGKDFLKDRDQSPLGFLAVLNCIGVNPNHTNTIAPLRERVSDLEEVTREWHRNFVELTNWREMSAESVQVTVERVGDRYTLFCQQLSEFCSMLGMESDFTQQAMEDKTYLEAFFQTVDTH